MQKENHLAAQKAFFPALYTRIKQIFLCKHFVYIENIMHEAEKTQEESLKNPKHEFLRSRVGKDTPDLEVKLLISEMRRIRAQHLISGRDRARAQVSWPVVMHLPLHYLFPAPDPALAPLGGTHHEWHNHSPTQHGNGRGRFSLPAEFSVPLKTQADPVRSTFMCFMKHQKKSQCLAHFNPTSVYWASTTCRSRQSGWWKVLNARLKYSGICPQRRALEGLCTEKWHSYVSLER